MLLKLPVCVVPVMLLCLSTHVSMGEEEASIKDDEDGEQPMSGRYILREIRGGSCNASLWQPS